MPANRWSQGKRLSVDLQHMEVLERVAKSQTERRKQLEKTETEKRNRKTFQLASEIVNSVDPSQSIAQLETLGEDRLTTILEWLQSA